MGPSEPSSLFKGVQARATQPTLPGGFDEPRPGVALARGWRVCYLLPYGLRRVYYYREKKEGHTPHHSLSPESSGKALAHTEVLPTYNYTTTTYRPQPIGG